MNRAKTLVTVLGVVGGLSLSLGAGSVTASAQARRATLPMTTAFPRLPPPPPIVGYPPQIYMFGLPPGVVGPSFNSNFGFEGREHRHEFHRFDRRLEHPHDD